MRDRLITQNRFAPEGEVVVSSDRIKKGDTSLSVFLEVIEAHPQIARVFYTWYPADLRTYSYDHIQKREKFGLARSLVSKENIIKIGENIKRDTGYWLEWDEDSPGKSEFYSCAVAICSEVRLLGGEECHIPLLDFICKPHAYQFEEMCEEIKEPGHLLYTGDRGDGFGSYHFIGFNLMDKPTWDSWMDRLINVEENRFNPMYDLEWLNISREVGYSALRITANPPYKLDEPKVRYINALG